MTRVKICGIREFEDARDAALLGAHAIGLNFYPSSPRYIEPAQAAQIIEKLPPFVNIVGIFVNHPDPRISRISPSPSVCMPSNFMATKRPITVR